jgi:Holliday junction resolvasome RuvABC ATP-dependent DNA helicase subunit
MTAISPKPSSACGQMDAVLRKEKRCLDVYRKVRLACAYGMSARETPRLALKLSRLVRARCALNSRVRAGDPRHCAATADSGRRA